MRVAAIIPVLIVLIEGCTAHRAPSPVTAVVIPAESVTVTATYTLTAVSTHTPAASISPTHTPAATATATATPGCFVVTFADPNLEQLIRAKIAKYSGDIYNCDLAGIYEIDVVFEIYDLSGLEYCTNVKYLDLDFFKGNTLAQLATMKQLVNIHIHGKGQVIDITSLSECTILSTLKLINVDISGTVSSISNLFNLVVLDLDSESLPNLSALSALTKLVYLSVSASNLSDISAISGLTNVEYLDIVAGGITSLSVLSGLDLREFSFTHLPRYIRRSIVSDLSPFAGMTNLEIFRVSGAEITDISPLSNCTSLINLTINDTLITNLNALSALSNLQDVTLWENINLDDISGLANSKSISDLSIIGSKVSDISAISTMSCLFSIDLPNNMITDIHPIVLNAQDSSCGQSPYSIFLTGNPLSAAALADIELLENTYGVSVMYE
ncbi:MAG: hypothetical protein CVV21_02450 [Candidatus Goldiibacteriota bacterium HGW-Goldbacteria-1]|jgi:internalin A|nr:MAG: hypothetical protein CVV21_02450 [Candidatus Goldiibacteriota bacterium HGW-Goldbacteria-1]